MISVVVPCFNRSHIIKKCIDSVLNQTFKDFELIIIDNGSTDDTKAVVQSYIDQDSRVKYFWQENTGSPAGSRNSGIRTSSGQWISFLDSDDRWLDNKLEVVSEEIKHSTEQTIAISHWENHYIDNTFSKVLNHGYLGNENLYKKLLFKGNCYSTSAMTVKKSAILEVGLFNESKSYFAVEDYDMWLRLTTIGSITNLKQSLGEFHVNSDNMSGDPELVNENLKNVVSDHIRQLSVKNEKHVLKINRARIDYYKARTYQMEGEFNKSLKALTPSILSDPWKVKKWICLIFCILRITK
jgi:glycosyltransferase involved in cell wall biosynthesis